MRNEFRNDATAEERAEQLRNEKRLREEAEAPSTFFAIARAGIDLSLSGEGSAGGYVAGSEPFVRYPAAAPGYSGGPHPGLEPPFPVDISFVEPIGTAAEIEQSIQLAEPADPTAEEAPLAAVVDRGSAIPTDVHDRLQSALARGLRRRKL
jgi:hypothetical protein